MRPSGADAARTPTGKQATGSVIVDGSSLGIYVKKIDEEELSLNPTVLINSLA